MGVAAYNRGTMLIRDQADRDVQATLPAIERRHYSELNKEQAATIASLQNDLERARRLIGLLRAEKAVLRDELSETRDKLTNRARNAERQSRRFYRSWVKASRLLRMFSPAQVQSAREQLTETV